MSNKMPIQRRGSSNQGYQTPPEFLAAVLHLLGIDQFAIDLAATPENAVCPRFYTEQDNSLVQDWCAFRGEIPYCIFMGQVPQRGWNWLNPPFGSIPLWVKKAKISSAQTAMLVPSSTGANWWRDHVHLKAHILLLNGRITFVECKDPYPKDCALLLYSRDYPPGYTIWEWMKQLPVELRPKKRRR